MAEQKQYFLDRHRFIMIAIILLIMWAGFMIFYYLKADEITRDPCSICSERMGKDVSCILQQPYPVTKTYYPNGSYSDNTEEIKRQIYDENTKKNAVNFSFNNLIINNSGD